MVLKSKVIDMIRLTIVGDVDRRARIENGENTGMVKTSCICGAVLDLRVGSERISTRVRQETMQVVYLGAIE